MGTISWNYVKACEKLDDIGSYGWAKEVGNFLKKSMHMLKKKKSGNSNTMGGCIVLILYWFRDLGKWDIKSLILEKLNKLFAKLKEDAEETESKEFGSDEGTNGSEPEVQAVDDQSSEEEKDN